MGGPGARSVRRHTCACAHALTRAHTYTHAHGGSMAVRGACLWCAFFAWEGCVGVLRPSCTAASTQERKRAGAFLPAAQTCTWSSKACQQS